MHKHGPNFPFCSTQDTPHLFFKTLVKKFFVTYYCVIGYQPAMYDDNKCCSRNGYTPRGRGKAYASA